MWCFTPEVRLLFGEAMRITSEKNVGIAGTPTARLHLPGTTAATTAPLKFTSGTNMTTPEAGAVEWNGSNLFITQTSGPTRKTLAYTTDVKLSSLFAADATNSIDNLNYGQTWAWSTATTGTPMTWTNAALTSGVCFTPPTPSPAAPSTNSAQATTA